MREREYRFDIIRLISTFLVIMIHMSNHYCRHFSHIEMNSFVGASIFNSIGRISVPLFFMISGALTLGRDIPIKKLINKILHFIFVLAVWSLIYIVFDIKYMGYSFTKEQYIKLVFVELKAHMWFMYVIIGLYIISPFARILIKNMNDELRKYFMLLWVTFCGGGFLLKVILVWFKISTKLNYPIPLIQGTYYLGYFMAGKIIYDKIKEGHRFKKSISLITLILSLGFAAGGTILYSLNNNKYYSSFLCYRNLPIILASLSAYVLLLSLPELKSDKVKGFLSRISPVLFGIYLSHIIWFDFLIKENKVYEINSFIGIPAATILIFTVSLTVVYILSKIPIVRKIIE